MFHQFNIINIKMIRFKKKSESVTNETKTEKKWRSRSSRGNSKESDFRISRNTVSTLRDETPRHLRIIFIFLFYLVSLKSLYS